MQTFLLLFPFLDDSTFDFRLFLFPPIMLVLARSLTHVVPAFTWFFAIKTIPTNIRFEALYFYNCEYAYNVYLYFIRATGLGFCFFWSQIAKMCVPHLSVLVIIVRWR